MNLPKDAFFDNPSELGKWVAQGLETGAEEARLKEEIEMMREARNQTANEIIEQEIELIERMKRECAVNVNE